MHTNKLYEILQIAYIKGTSTETALVKVQRVNEGQIKVTIEIIRDFDMENITVKLQNDVCNS